MHPINGRTLMDLESRKLRRQTIIGRREYESECVCVCVGGGVVIQCHIAIVNKVGLPAKDE